MSKHDYSNRKYVIVPYNPEWPKMFQRIRNTLVPVFGNIAERIEHIGSTAIPGMVGKPTVDVLVIVKHIFEVDALNLKMADLGYLALGEYVVPGGRLFALEKNSERQANIHCFAADHPKTKQLLSWREYLLTHPEEAHAYAQLKQNLYTRYPTDYGAYRKEKDAYMTELNKRAEAWWSRRI